MILGYIWDTFPKGLIDLSKIIKSSNEYILKRPTVRNINNLIKKMEAMMDKQEIEAIVKREMEELSKYMLNRIEALERKIEVQATEIKILKEGGNL